MHTFTSPWIRYFCSCSPAAANWLGVEFKKPCALLVEVVDEVPVFAKVNDLFVLDNRPVAHTTLHKTLSFNKHFHHFCVRLTHVSKVIDLKSTPSSYHVRSFAHISQQLIVPKFKIAGLFI